MKKAESESDILSAICDYLAYRGYLFWRSNNIPVPIFGKGGMAFRAMPKHSMKGIPDIVVITKGLFVGVEVKKKGGYQSEHQKEFQRRCEQAGARYVLARSIDDIQHAGL